MKPKPKEFDSPEEEWFSWYCDELVEAGLAASWERAPTYPLSSAIRRTFHGSRAKSAVKDLLEDHEYTPDFRIQWEPQADGLLTQSWCSDPVDDRIPFLHGCSYGTHAHLTSLVEVKPFFDRHGKTAWARCQIKWVVQKYGVMPQIHKVGTHKSPGIFSRTFTPKRYLLTAKTGKARALHHTPRSCTEYVAIRVQQQEWDKATEGLSQKELNAARKAGCYGGAVFIP